MTLRISGVSVRTESVLYGIFIWEDGVLEFGRMGGYVNAMGRSERMVGGSEFWSYVILVQTMLSMLIVRTTC